MAEVLVYRATADFLSNTITTGPMAGLSGPITAEISIDTDAVPISEETTTIQYVVGSGRVIDADASVGAYRVPFITEDGSEQAQDGWDLAPNTYLDAFEIVAREQASAFRVARAISISGGRADIDAEVFTATDWRLPAAGPGVIDISGFTDFRFIRIFGNAPGEQIDGFLTSLEVVRPEPCVGDVTTTGENPGDPLYGVPDGEVDGSDLSFFVEFWLAGCP